MVWIFIGFGCNQLAGCAPASEVDERHLKVDGGYGLRYARASHSLVAERVGTKCSFAGVGSALAACLRCGAYRLTARLL